MKARYLRIKGSFKRRLGMSSGNASSASLPDLHQPTGSLSPVPLATRRAITPVPAHPDPGSGRLRLPDAATTLSPSMGPVSLPTSSSVINAQGESHTQILGSAAPAAVEERCNVAEDKPAANAEEPSKSWPGLNLLLKALGVTAGVFSPLQATISTFADLVRVFEIASTDHNGYSDLRATLDTLLADISQHISDMTGPKMTRSVENLCAAIGAELEIVEQKIRRSTVQRHIEAIDDPDQVLECYRRIQGHLQRLTVKLNANLSVWNIVNTIETDARLQRLSPALSAVYDSAKSGDVQRRECTPGTRVPQRDQLLSWAKSLEANNVYWMSGMAGTGKTTIAYSLCAELEGRAILGASFFCSRLIPECRDVSLILPAIAYQLACFSYPFRCALSQAIEAEPDVHTRVLKKQFESLLVKPLLQAKNTLPVSLVVAIDALDECENKDAVGSILDILLFSAAVSELPIRFLISSRPEPEIYHRMLRRLGSGTDSRLVLYDLDAEVVRYDIGIYLRSELGSVGLSDTQLAALVELSGTLFIFASTAVRYIKEGLQYRIHKARVDEILGLESVTATSNQDEDKEKDKEIDKLYTSILQAVLNNQNLAKGIRTRMKLVLDTVICAQEPMNTECLSGLLRLQGSEQVEGLLRPLGSVLNISETTKIVTTLHASFPDYMRDANRSSSFHRSPGSFHARLAHACLEQIRLNSPQFNICGFKSSYHRDDDATTMAGVAGQVVSPQLYYACRYWIDHLEQEDTDGDSTKLVNEFASDRFLLWVEVLNVKKSIGLASGIMQRAESWCRANDAAEETVELVHDGWRFVTMFASHAVSQSTPHIYMSMLPFWPEPAPISKCYINRLRGVAQVEGSAMTRRQLALLATWPLPDSVWSVCFSPDESLLACAVGSSVFVIDGTTGLVVLGPLDHSDRVNDVVFSKDGTRVISCSHDRTLKVWDTTTGHLALEPPTGHTDYVNGVALFSDGKRVVSGSRDGTICVWSLESGRIVLGPLKSQNKEVWSVCVSSDGTRIASGHEDGAIHVWEAESGKILLGPLSGHTGVVDSISFSPDNARLVSGSRDNDIRLWNGLADQMNVDVLKGHTKLVWSVAFSPDGKKIASASYDWTIRLWDVEGSPKLSQVLNGHTSNVWCARFSSDGNRIVSCSSDRTIRAWDARTQAPQDSPLQGHTKAVTSVAFSHDATRILSGSNDGTIYIWDAHTGQIAVGPMKGHTDWVNSVCFSPDQSRIASGSEDKSVQLWDAYSGQAVGKPLSGHSGKVMSVCFSPDGGLVASGSEDKTIRLWDAQSGEAVGSPLKAHTGWVYSVCFSADGLRIVSGSGDKSVLVWNVNTRQPALPPLKGHTDQVRAVCVSPDGTRIASGSFDKTVRLWDLHGGQSVFEPLLGHTDKVYAACFSPDSSYVVSGSWDKTIRLWDARSGQAVGSPLIGHTDLVLSVAFSPKGGQIVSGSADPSIRVWDIADLVQVRQSQGDGDNATKPSHARQSWVLQDDGWVVDSESRLLAWVPPDLHASLMNPRNPLLISSQGAVQLDLESAKLGESWTECYKP